MNVSTNLANYLILAADSGPAFSANQFREINETDLEGFTSGLANTEEELRTILRNDETDIYKLFKSIAVR
jgi:hypothetical protein